MLNENWKIRGAFAGALVTVITSGCSDGKSPAPAPVTRERLDLPIYDATDYCTPNWHTHTGRIDSITTAGKMDALPNEEVIDQLILKLKAAAEGTPDTNDRTRVEAVAHRIVDALLRDDATEVITLKTLARASLIRYDHAMSGGAAIIRLATGLPEGEAKRFVAALQADSEVEYADLDRLEEHLSVQSVGIDSSTSISNVETRDSMWHLKAINAEAAMRRAGSQRKSSNVVAVLDGGFAEHPALEGNRIDRGKAFTWSLAEPCARLGVIDLDKQRECMLKPHPLDTAMQKSLNGFEQPGTSPTGHSLQILDSLHGTEVAGFIGAQENREYHAHGVNPDAQLLYVRVSPMTRMHASDVLDAMRWSVGLDIQRDGQSWPHPSTPARVINLSLSRTLAEQSARRHEACGPALIDAIRDVRSAGTTIVVAAGNDAAPSSWASPGNCPGVITVGATDVEGKRGVLTSNGKTLKGSNYGKNVTISAPGWDVLTLSVKSAPLDASTCLPRYQAMGICDDLETSGIPAKFPRKTTDPTERFDSGTSYAAPQVAGVISLMLAVNQELTPDAIKEILVATAQKPPASMHECVAPAGAGIVDADAAVKMAQTWRP
ncbi:serine protease [Robbsia andropogonis]|uniref:S8 family serine peptidase n=1 Tax=Robbsia andropogonis TaxID=28092 RepID=UPI003D1FD1D9